MPANRQLHAFQLFELEDGVTPLPTAPAPNATQEERAAYAADLARSRADSALDSKARAFIQRHVSNLHIFTVKHANSAQDAWQTLESQFTESSVARQSQLQQRLSLLRMESGESVARFFARLQQLLTELEACDCETSESTVVLAVLAALPPEYEGTVERLRYDQTSADLKRNRMKTLFSNPVRPSSPGRRRSPGSSSSPARTSSPSRGRAQTPGRAAAQSPSRGASLFTYSTADDDDDDDFDDVLMQMVQPRLNFNSDLYSPFCIDSGASQHILKDLQFFYNYTAFAPDKHRPVKLAAAGHKVWAVGSGSVFLSTKRGSWFLSHALYVPDSKQNFISVAAATEEGSSFLFRGDLCQISSNQFGSMLRVNAHKIRNSYILAAVPMPDGPDTDSEQEQGAKLYGIKQSALQPDHRVQLEPLTNVAAPSANSATSNSPQVWHQRLCHASYDALARMQSEGMVLGVPITTAQFRAAASDPAVCVGCVKGKQHKNVAFAGPSPNAAPVTAPLGLIHMDVSGPMTVIEELETQSGFRCKAIRTDNGTEYVNSRMKEYCRSKGIVHQHSAPYSPQQNGAAERLNRTIFEKARSIIHSADISLSFWAHAVKFANHVRCLLPVSGQPLTPWEAFYGVKPDLSGLRVIRQPELNAMTVSDSPINDTPTVAEALAGPMADLWIEAMNAELASLHANQTWCLEERPANARVLPTKWVLKVKRDAAGNIEKLKARLVAKGFYQQSALSRVSSKPSSLASYRRFADTVLATYDAMWAEVSKKRWANAKFRLYCGKKRVVASFWAKVNKQAKKLWPDRILALAYGAAGFNGSGTIGCRDVPVSQMQKEAVKQFMPERVVLVDEFRTSRVSSADNTPSETLLDMPPESFRWLRPVKSMAKRSQVRGLMCLTSINNITRFYDRDVSAALNIRRCAVGPGPRPTELCYRTNRPAMPQPGQPGQDWVEIPDKPLMRKWQRQLQQ
ncbi:hypothetical protein QJQ45_027936 [Haematococcus lacustris]|nr:hypothetical protein QJQ45_027936 [Haematococcus lacustris]